MHLCLCVICNTLSDDAEIAAYSAAIQMVQN